MRSFSDSKGTVWRVWATRPEAPGAVIEDLRAGWLTFDNGTERRRLAPIPQGWESYAVDRLELACRAARRARTSDPNGISVLREENNDRA